MARPPGAPWDRRYAGDPRDTQRRGARRPAGCTDGVRVPIEPAARHFDATRRGVGIEVVYIEHGSAAEAAGIRAGDLITEIGAIDAPTAAEVRSAFASAQAGDILIVAITRGATHRVMGLQR